QGSDPAKTSLHPRITFGSGNLRHLLSRKALETCRDGSIPASRHWTQQRAADAYLHRAHRNEKRHTVPCVPFRLYATLYPCNGTQPAGAQEESRLLCPYGQKPILTGPARLLRAGVGG